MGATALQLTPATDYGWNWSAFLGSEMALKYARRDLPDLDRAVALVSERRVAVQAGGNLGIYPKRLAQHFATVYSFEPSADLFPLMLRNAPESNIVRFQAALGCQRELVNTCAIRRDGKKFSHEGLTHIAGTGNIPTLQVDDLGLPVCDFLQLDLEGYELYALQGAVETLRRCRPVILVEINKSLQFVGIEADSVRGFLFAEGYRFVERMKSDELYVPCH